MRILVRTSRWAIWARRLGSFALPLVLIPVLMHRAGAVPSQTFEIVEGFGLVVAVLAIAAGIVALARIWVTGDRGWGYAATAIVLGLVCLGPLGLWIGSSTLYPHALDVSSDAADPPSIADRPYAAPAPAVEQKLAATYPNLQNRTYPLGAAQVYGIVARLAADKGWEIREQREPVDDSEDGDIQAVAVTLLGFRDAVAIRVRPLDQRTEVAMRSAALSPDEEPGANASRVDAFLTALDTAISSLVNGTPAGSSADDNGDNAQAPVVPAPPPRGKRR